MTSWYFIGIDIGLNGGLVLMSPDGVVVEAVKMPDGVYQIFEKLQEWSEKYPVKCCIEKQNPRPTDGSRSVATYFEHYGVVKSVVSLLEIPHVFKTPKTWQKFYNVSRKSGESYDRYKRRLRDLARQIHPESKPTMATADAVLIASYYRHNY